MVDGQAGKGDKPRPVDKKKFDESIERLYGDHCRFPHKHGPDCKLKSGDTDEDKVSEG